MESEIEIETCSERFLWHGMQHYDKSKDELSQSRVQECKERLHNLKTGKTKLAADHKDSYLPSYMN
jgi:hypothetical protein